MAAEITTMDTKICARRGGGAQREGGPGGSEAHAAARHLRDARTLGVNRQARGGERVFPSTASGWDGGRGGEGMAVQGEGNLEVFCRASQLRNYYFDNF